MSTSMKLLLLVAASLVASCHGAFDTSFASKLDEIKKTLDEAQQDGVATSRHPLDILDIEDLKISSRLLLQATPAYPAPAAYGGPNNLLDTLPTGLTAATARKLNFRVVMDGDFGAVSSQIDAFTVDARTAIATAMGSTFYRGQVQMTNTTAGSVVSTITLLLDPTVDTATVESYKTKLTTEEATIFTPLSKYGVSNPTVTFVSDSAAGTGGDRDSAATIATASATTMLAAFGALLLGALLF